MQPNKNEMRCITLINYNEREDVLLIVCVIVKSYTSFHYKLVQDLNYLGYLWPCLLISLKTYDYILHSP